MSDRAKIKQDKGGLYIYIRHQGERHYITSYMGHPDLSFRDNSSLAQKAKAVIDSEIDKGVFRPERWKMKARRLFNLEGYSQKWLQAVKPSLSAATWDDYRNSFKNHINPIIGYEYIEDLNLDKLTHLLNSIKRAPKGKKNVMDALKRMLKYAFQNGHINQMPIFPEFRGVNKIVQREIVWVESPERMKILEEIPLKHRPIFTFIMLTGCRTSEARAFRKQDIKGDHIVFAVTFGRDQKLKEVKGKKVKPFPLTEALQELFDSMPKTLGPWVFVNPQTNRPYNRNLQRDIFNPACKRVGINISLNEWGRKSFAMLMLQHMDKGMVSHLLRHQDPRMIDHYAEYQTRPLKAALDKVHRINVKGKKMDDKLH